MFPAFLELKDDSGRELIDDNRPELIDDTGRESRKLSNSSIYTAEPESYLPNGTTSPPTVDDIKTIYVNPEPSMVTLTDREIKESTRNCLIILLSLLMRCFMLVCEEYSLYFFRASFSTLHLNKVFFPLLGYEMLEFILFKPPVQTNNLLLRFIMLKFHPRHVHNVTLFFGTISRISQDIMVYFFTFVCFESVICLILQNR